MITYFLIEFLSFSGITPWIVDKIFLFKLPSLTYKNSSTCFIVLNITNAGLPIDIISKISIKIFNLFNNDSNPNLHI